MTRQDRYLNFGNLAAQDEAEYVPDSVYAMDAASQFEAPHGSFEIFPINKPSIDEQRAGITAARRQGPSDLRWIGYWPQRQKGSH